MKLTKPKWWKTEEKNYDQDYDATYYDNEADSASKADDASSADLYNYDDPESGDVSIVLSEQPAEEVAQAEPEPLLKRTFKPTDCQDGKIIVDAYKEGRVIVVCIEKLDKPNFYRVFDYLMGAVHALDGDIRKLDRETVVLLPYGVEKDIDIDTIEEETLPESASDENKDA